MGQYHSCVSMLDKKTNIIYDGHKKILGVKRTIQFSLIYVEHKNCETHYSRER